MNDVRRKKYAQMLVRVGVNLQPGQYLILQTSSENVDLAREITAEAFAAGARDVLVFMDDPEIDHLRCKNASSEELRAVPDWKKEQLDFYLKQDCCQLGLMGSYPTLNNDVDTAKLLAFNGARNDVRNVIRSYIHQGILQWSGTVAVTMDWAKAVYPELPDAEAFTALEDALCQMCRIDDETDVVANWNKHCDEMAVHSDKLNAYNFKSLHITTELGTDITMDLVKDHIWTSAGEMCEGKHKVRYVANMPTEEIFTDPHCYSVNGVAYASRPLMMSGKLVTDFSISFKDGYAIDCAAGANVECLRDALFKDNGTRRLGEVALVSKNSPIAKMGRIFYNGLIDENAASHLAFGTSFPSCLKGGTTLSKEELLERGVNVAVSHNDFMIGTAEMKVVGTRFDGTEVVIMDDGDFVI